MKILFKIFVPISILCLMVFFMSCDEYGGTIIIKNNYNEDKTVTVYSDFSVSYIIFSYKDAYGPIKITAGSTGNINVKTNTNYGVMWRDAGIDKYKTVKISNGETVEINIP